MSPARPRGRALAVLGVAAVTTGALLAATGLAPASASTGSSTAVPADRQSKHHKPRHHARKPVKLQILALNDFHGQLEPLDPAATSSGRINETPAGGAAYLATHLKSLRARAAAHGRRSVTVAAGDLVGASPLLSAAFHDEPTIEAMNKMGLQISSVGNHEFDEGWRELVRMQRGGCLDDGAGRNNQNSCPDHRFKGARFRYLSANVFHKNNGRTVFPGVAGQRDGGGESGLIRGAAAKTPHH